MLPLRLPSVLAMAAIWLTAGCGSKGGGCPGMCPDEPWPPTMTITTADGTASIASATVANGPCAVLLFESAGEVGVPESYAAVRVSYSGPRDIPPICVIELTSVSGGIEDLGVHITSSASQEICCPYGACCPDTDAATVLYHVVFDPAAVTVSFPPAPDGGTADDGADASTGAPEVAADVSAPPIDEMAMDLGEDGAGADVAALDLPIGGVDGGGAEEVDDGEAYYRSRPINRKPGARSLEPSSVAGEARPMPPP